MLLMSENKFKNVLDRLFNYVLAISAIYLALILGKPDTEYRNALLISLVLFSCLLGTVLVIKKYNLTKYIEWNRL